MPWPNVAEIEAVMPAGTWTLVGGLMVQLHAIHSGIGAVRPTSDVDMVLHVETTRGIAGITARALESLGYSLVTSMNARTQTAHRFRRGAASVDLVSSAPDVVDVLAADHAAPRSHQTLSGRRMVQIDGGTQALRRTLNARLRIDPDRSSLISVPTPFGAVILKSAAYRADSRDGRRHLQDAAVLLSVIEDPFEERAHVAGSDRARIRTLVQALPDDAPEWRFMTEPWRSGGQAALRVLAQG